MDEKELLEFAAQAEGRDLSQWEWRLGAFWLPETKTRMCDHWQPLHKDQDAFRLALKLGMNLYSSNYQAMVAEILPSGDEGAIIEMQEGDYHPKAMRMAIVKAAAELGRRM